MLLELLRRFCLVLPEPEQKLVQSISFASGHTVHMLYLYL
jgi:hypothetical protein